MFMPANSAVGQATEKKPTSEPAPQHRLRAEAVGLAHDHGEQRRGHVGADVEQPRAVAHQRGALDIRADHDARAVDQVEHRDVERVAQLHEARALVGAVGVDRAGEVMRIVGDHAHRPALDADEGGDDADAELRPQSPARSPCRRSCAGSRACRRGAGDSPESTMPQLALVVRLPMLAIAPWKYERYFFTVSTASTSSLTRMSTTPFGTWNDIGPTSSGV